MDSDGSVRSMRRRRNGCEPRLRNCGRSLRIQSQWSGCLRRRPTLERYNAVIGWARKGLIKKRQKRKGGGLLVDNDEVREFAAAKSGKRG
jgi:hypothetical protein